jgi:hypothetical protein
MVAMAVLVLVAVITTQALLQINRRAAIARVMNAAKAEALSRIQQVSQASYNPDASPQVIPDILVIKDPPQVTDVDLGSSNTGLGSVPAKVTWTVATPVPSNPKIRSVHCKIDYKYLSRDLSYELFTYKSPD